MVIVRLLALFWPHVYRVRITYDLWYVRERGWRAASSQSGDDALSVDVFFVPCAE